MVTVMFATHEMPQSGRLRVLRNAMRLARKIVQVRVRALLPQHIATLQPARHSTHQLRVPLQVVDISPDYHEVLATKPLQGTSFLMGKPKI